MNYDTDNTEFLKLIGDKQTVVTMTNNDNGNGGRIIIADACIRPHSLIRDDYLNPVRNISHIPTQYVRSCPRCGEEWTAIHTVVAGATEYYGCSDRCGVSICSDTYDRFARVFIKDGVSEDDMPRESEDVSPMTLTLTDDTEPVLTLTLDHSEPVLTLTLDDDDGDDGDDVVYGLITSEGMLQLTTSDEVVFNPVTGEWE